MSEIKKSVEIGENTLVLSTGKIAKQANSAVMASYGDTVVLATVVSAPLIVDLGYFPLMVEYQERLYAGGRIKGSRWVKREGRPTDDEILSARLIDRSIRPLFPKSYKKEVQVIVTVLSVDLENSPDVVAAVAVSGALASSTIPWSGPVATVRVGKLGENFKAYPKVSEQAFSELDLVVSSSKDAIVMIEAGSKEVTEEIMLSALDFAKKEGEKVIKLIEDFSSEVKAVKEKISANPKIAEIESQVKKLATEKIEDLIKKTSIKKAGQYEYNELRASVVANFSREDSGLASEAFEHLFREVGRKMVLNGTRPDGRKYDQLRVLQGEVGILPRTHGSALFSRGETQALTVTTLGSHSLEQLIETAEGEESKRYMHHYSMPPYATGETGKIGSPSRREIGHGALAERALIPVIPDESVFPYTIRVVSEIMSSNGSTSMASVTGSTLSLMDAGVPISSPVAGIAMGLIIESDKKFAVLTDITGLEDGIGDMDFKVAGTKKGITALQLDVKTLNLSLLILKEAFSQAKKAREEILKLVEKTISEPRKQVSAFAPKIKLLKIGVDKIGEVIGPGGRTIKKIIAESGAQVEVEDDGTIHLTAVSEESLSKAAQIVEGMTKEVVSGEIYAGVVKRIQPFGIFVEILPGKEGMVHVSDMSTDFVKDPADLVKIGDQIQVRVREVDDLGRINLSMNMDASLDKPRVRKSQHSEDRGNFRGQRRSFSGGNFRSSGPHFPASRLIDTKLRTGVKKNFGR